MRLRNRNDEIRNREKYKYPDRYWSILINIDQYWSIVTADQSLVRWNEAIYPDQYPDQYWSMLINIDQYWSIVTADQSLQRWNEA